MLKNLLMHGFVANACDNNISAAVIIKFNYKCGASK